MSLDRTGGICPNPECEQKLQPLAPSYEWLKKAGLLMLLALILGGGGWYYFHRDGGHVINGGLSCNETISENIAEIQAQIEAIQTKIASTPVPTTQLENVQKQIKDIQTQINQCPESSNTQIVEQHQRIEEIYTQLVDNIQKQLETIEEQMSTESPHSLIPKLETLREQVEAIQEAISGTIGGPAITALQRRLNELQEKIEQLIAILSCKKRKIPQCLSSASPEMQNKLPMFCVPPVQKRKVPKHLHVWMKGIANSEIDESAFFIMRREVKVGEFRDYVNTLDETQRQKLGTAWRQEEQWDFPNAKSRDLPDDNPVASVPWWAANGYAQWLAKKTGCPLALPTYNQWVAAAISYASPKLAVIQDTHFESGPKQRMNEGSSGGLDLLLMGSSENLPSVLDLLGNLREWSRDECNGGHYLLGADYKTSRANILGEKVCEAYALDTIGFRLVLQAVQ
jgi:HPt (histidine-containing phosphotransfer) domain-containing protein